ncbi:MAG: PPC domain-containing protein [Synergistaceae bacterium]|nr:PPC domain-containing protein [Synergistaceae bacterium]
MDNKRFFSALATVALLFLAALGGGGCGGSSSSRSANLTAGSTVALDFDDEEAIYNVFLAEYNGWNNVEAAQTPYEGSVSVPAFIHSKKLPNAATPDVISVNLSAGTEYTVEFSRNLCEFLGDLLPDIRLYAPDGSEVDESSVALTVYPEENPSIICLTFTPSAAGTYRIQVFSADADYDGNDGYILRVYKEMRNPEDDNRAGYPVRYTVSNSSGKTAIVTADDIILFRRLLID